jgi:hypothetical protein
MAETKLIVLAGDSQKQNPKKESTRAKAIHVM